MAERPTLPLETQANIESARDQVLRKRVLYTLLFGPEKQMHFVGMAGVPPQRKPATLKLQIKEYSSALFNAEAQHYRKHARDESELRSWLDELALCIADEVTQELEQDARFYDFHCIYSDRQRALHEALGDRVEYWIKRAKPAPKLPVNPASVVIPEGPANPAATTTPPDENDQ